jgi:hypothetical protein
VDTSAPIRDQATRDDHARPEVLRVRSEPISPELALVDPDLAARARAALPDRPPAPRRPASRSAPPAPRTEPAPPSKPGSPLWAKLVAIVWILVVGILIGGAAVPHAQDRPRVVPASEDVACERPAEPGTQPMRPTLPNRPLGPIGGPRSPERRGQASAGPRSPP